MRNLDEVIDAALDAGYKNAHANNEAMAGQPMPVGLKGYLVQAVVSAVTSAEAESDGDADEVTELVATDPVVDTSGYPEANPDDQAGPQPDDKPQE